jgi:hypothetical protein
MKALYAIYYQRKMKQPTRNKCRMCCKADENIKHVVEGSTIFVPCENINKHNKVVGYIHWMLCKHTGLQV